MLAEIFPWTKECDFTYEKWTDYTNNSTREGLFPDSLKKANITIVHEKNHPLEKENYRSVSILPLPLKVYERSIFNQLSEYMQNVLNKILYGVHKPDSTQRALFKLLQTWQRELDKSAVDTILTDFSKPYVCIPIFVYVYL